MKKGMKLKMKVLLGVVIALLGLMISSCFVLAAPSFNISAARMKRDINGHSVNITINGTNQVFVADTSEIKKFIIKSRKFSNNGQKATVTTYALFNRDIAIVKTKAVLVYEYKNNKWKCTNVTLANSTLSSVKLKGTWKGIYYNQGKEVGCTLEIKSVSSDGFANGIFSFYATPSNPKFKSGSYKITGGCSLKTGQVSFVADGWIDKPTNYNTLDFDNSFLDLSRKRIKGNHSLSIERID